MAMFGDYEKVLGHIRLTGLVTKDAPVDELAGSEIFTNRRVVDTPTFTFDIVREPTTPARITAIGAKATRIPRFKVGQASAAITEINEFEVLEKKDILYLRQPGTEHEPMMLQQIQKAQDRMMKRIRRRKEILLWDILAGSYSQAQKDEKIHPLTYTTTFPIQQYNSPAVNKWISLTGDESIAGSPGAPILSNDLVKIERDFRRLSFGNTISRAYANGVTTDAMIKNVQVSKWWKDQGARDKQILDVHFFKNLGTWQWTRYEGADTLTAADDTSRTMTYHIPDNIVYLMPAGNVAGCTWVEGPNIAPLDAIGQTADSVIQTVKSGIVSYAKWHDDPQGVAIYVSYAFGAYIEFPEAIMKMTLQ
jgi:hypothetical protein